MKGVLPQKSMSKIYNIPLFPWIDVCLLNKSLANVGYDPNSISDTHYLIFHFFQQQKQGKNVEGPI